MAAGATYSFSSQPKPVSASRKKYRDPGEFDATMYRDLKETSIMWDKRVHRGNTYSMYTRNAERDALQDATMLGSPQQQPRRRKQKKEPNIFAMPLPEEERVPVDLSAHLIAREQVIEVECIEAQTDEFLPEPPPEQYQPQKTGVDVYTQVEDGELFDFDMEVEPILDVLVNKTLEQSVMEVEEEFEMDSMNTFKTEWYRRQEAMMKDWQAHVQAERALWEQKEVIMKQKREEKHREAQVKLKMQAMALAKQQLARAVPNAVSQLQEVAFPDSKGIAINRIFLPELFSQVQQQVQTVNASRQLLDEMIAGSVRTRAAARSSALAEQRARHKELERRRHEEWQIRQGKIRILVDTGAAEKVAVGPVQLSSEDSIEQVQSRVYAWLKENERQLAASWQHGVILCIDGAPVEETLQLFEARAGQISMVARPPPPPTPEEEAEEGEGEEEEAEGGDQ